jgi:hypothetical protein
MSDGAIAAAIAVAGTTGGVIRVPGGTYKFASPIDLATKVNVTIEGDGGCTSGAPAATQLIYTGTGTGVFISLNSAVGCSLRALQIFNASAAFTGTLIKCSNDGSHGDPTYCGVYDCTFGAATGAGTVHLDLDKCVIFTAERCSFSYGNPSIKGQNASGGSYSNVVRFRDCTWLQSYVAPVQDGGQAWSFDGCTFESLASGAPGAFLCTSPDAVVHGLSFTSCWFGDASTTPGSWVDVRGGGLSFTGNYVSGNAVGTTGIHFREFVGATLHSNIFDTMDTAINFPVAGSHTIDVAGNVFQSVKTPLGNTQNASPNLVFNPNYPLLTPPDSAQGLFGPNGAEVSPNGIVRQWGMATIGAGTQLQLQFPMPFPNSCWGVLCQLSQVSGNANTLRTGTPGTTGVTVSCFGAAGSNTFYWQAIGN